VHERAARQLLGEPIPGASVVVLEPLTRDRHRLCPAGHVEENWISQHEIRAGDAQSRQVTTRLIV
jgi:hypothetical protein